VMGLASEKEVAYLREELRRLRVAHDAVVADLCEHLGLVLLQRNDHDYIGPLPWVFEHQYVPQPRQPLKTRRPARGKR
jgi:hypothetical protein